ncbi:type II toxin-antitoxin system HipA family toxin [Arthrobacter sp. H41]|uniref:type II toxin-antitoxin system HipA family toxin n=1 Tax=Arthrobacter sp. H41 TaxID=1312978 RepID=UPI00047987F1|nr:HipA domain-containing protein [Arthrobacter sp. H41]
MGELRVELYGHLVGWLTGTDWRSFDFRTDRSAFDHFELGSTILSESVPLDLVMNRGRASRRRNFFAELLPEGRILTNLAASVGAREHDIIALLSHFGRDVAGALQIWDPEHPGEPRRPRTEALTAKGVGSLLLATAVEPLANRPLSGKTSLAGVQDKIVLARIDDAWHRVHDGYPSTHIVKPESRDHPTIIYDEDYGARAARALELSRTETRLADFAGVPALVIERFDRAPTAPMGRIHQEDMNQALGAHGNEKYQELGGKVSLRRVAELFRRNGDDESLEQLLVLTVLTVAFGNLDMHAKNLSLLHHLDGRSQLAPAYDVVPMRHQNTDGRMALSVNGIYRHADLATSDLAAEAKSWRMRRPEPVISRTLDAIEAFATGQEPDRRAHPGLQRDVQKFTRRLLVGKPAGR